MLGNKCDCNAIRQVNSDTASSWARSNAIRPYEVTVMNRDCLKEPFCYIAWRMANPGMLSTNACVSVCAHTWCHDVRMKVGWLVAMVVVVSLSCQECDGAHTESTQTHSICVLLLPQSQNHVVQVEVSLHFLSSPLYPAPLQDLFHPLITHPLSRAHLREQSKWMKHAETVPVLPWVSRWQLMAVLKMLCFLPSEEEQLPSSLETVSMQSPNH